MGRLLRIFGAAALVLLIGAFAYKQMKDPEKATLDAAARATAPGKFVTLTHGVTHYDITGPDTGRTVVLVHGFSVPYYIWDSTAAGLSQAGYRVVRYDLYGRGWSDRPNVTYDGALFDAQLDELLDSLHLTAPIDLVGVSFGGYVTAHFTGSHPERIRTLTLVDPVARGRTIPGLLRVPLVGAYFWQVAQVPHMAEGQPSDFLHPERYPTWVDQYLPQMRFKGFGHALLSSAFLTAATDYSALYGKVATTKVPVLLIWGKQDSTVPLPLSKVVRDAIPAAQFEPIDSSGHLPQIEHAPIVNGMLREFFEAHPGH